MSDTGFSAIILAAGAGLRMGGTVKKQFISVEGHPLIYYPLRTFEDSPVDDIIIVAPNEMASYVDEQIVRPYGFSKVKKIVFGGEERYLSAYEGLKAVENPYVLIHDGVRPCVSRQVIYSAMEATKKYSCCEVAVPSVDTIKICDDEGFVENTPDRSKVWNVQTPQGFRTKLLRDAYEKLFAAGDTDGLTDDAMVIERAFPEMRIKLVMGDYENIKVTTKNDLALVRYFAIHSGE